MEETQDNDKKRTQDLEAALVAARDLIQAMREYATQQAEENDELKSHVEMLKERLHHEAPEAPEAPNAHDEKAKARARLQAWLSEAKEEKEEKMRSAMLDLENRNLQFQVEVLKKEQQQQQTPKKSVSLPAEEKQKSNGVSSGHLTLVLGAGVAFVVGVVIGAFVFAKKE